MSYKGLVFAAAALAGAFASTAASAMPTFAGLAPQPADAAAVKVHYDYSGYHYASRSRDSGYGSVRPSFWGYPELWLAGQPKVIATADEIQWERDYEDGYDGRYGGRPYDEAGLLGLPAALIGGVFGAAADAFNGAGRGSEYFGRPYDDDAYYGSEEDREHGYDSAYRRAEYDREQGYGSAYGDSGYDREPDYVSAYRGPRYYREHGYVSAYRGPRYYREHGYGSAYRGSEYYREHGYGSAYHGSEYYREHGYGSAYRGSGYDREPGYGSAYRGSGYDREPGYGSAYGGSGYYNGAVRSSGWGD